jgi:hypothetical protein
MRDDIRKKVSADIGAFGQHLVGVGRSADDPDDFLPFVYTIGNHEAGLPELLLIGDSGDLGPRILNILGRMQRERASAFGHGELVDFSARLPARLSDARARGRDEYSVQVGVYYRTERFEVSQVLLPDADGRFPGETGCMPPYSLQPVLTATH